MRSGENAMLRAIRHTAGAIAIVLGAVSAAQAEELIVSAAASLTNAFKAVGAGFEKTRPADKVVFNFSASGALLQQIENGAPADVFASADQVTMDQGVAKKLISSASRRDFASNRLVLIQPREGKPVLTSLASLAQPVARVRRIAICNPVSVPAGRYAREVLQGEKLWEALEPRFIHADTVRQAVDYVVRAEVDAGFVFATDVAAAKDKVNIVAELNTKTPVVYPIGVVEGSRHRKLAESFIACILAPEGQSILARYGFGKP